MPPLILFQNPTSEGRMCFAGGSGRQRSSIILTRALQSCRFCDRVLKSTQWPNPLGKARNCNILLVYPLQVSVPNNGKSSAVRGRHIHTNPYVNNTNNFCLRCIDQEAVFHATANYVVEDLASVTWVRNHLLKKRPETTCLQLHSGKYTTTLRQ